MKVASTIAALALTAAYPAFAQDTTAVIKG